LTSRGWEEERPSVGNEKPSPSLPPRTGFWVEPSNPLGGGVHFLDQDITTITKTNCENNARFSSSKLSENTGSKLVQTNKNSGKQVLFQDVVEDVCLNPLNPSL